jgi:hypothetical protein
MEHLFSPCSRLQDLLENQGNIGRPDRSYIALMEELNLDVSTEELLSAERAFTFADLYAMIENENAVLWLTPYAAVVRSNGRSHRDFKSLEADDTFKISVDGKEIYGVALTSEDSSVICDVVLRLLAANVVHSVSSIFLKKEGLDSSAWIKGPALASLIKQCQRLKSLTLQNLEMDEILCRVLGAYSRPDLDILLYLCTATNAGTSALAEILGKNQGPTTIECCELDSSILANGLRGNSCLKSLSPSTSMRVASSLEGDGDTRKVLAMAGALQENKGLIRLTLCHRCWSDETWGAICESLKTHPTLQFLSLVETYGGAPVDPAVLKSQLQALADMLKVNTTIQRIFLHSRYSEHELFRETIEPYLETNRFRPLVLAIQKTRPMSYRARVLGRALLATRTDPNRFWMLLSENADACC